MNFLIDNIIFWTFIAPLAKNKSIVNAFIQINLIYVGALCAFSIQFSFLFKSATSNQTIYCHSDGRLSQDNTNAFSSPFQYNTRITQSHIIHNTCEHNTSLPECNKVQGILNAKSETKRNWKEVARKKIDTELLNTPLHLSLI